MIKADITVPDIKDCLAQTWPISVFFLGLYLTLTGGIDGFNSAAYLPDMAYEGKKKGERQYYGNRRAGKQKVEKV